MTSYPPMMANPTPPSNIQALTVSELTGRIRATLEADFESVWVRGEISNFAAPSSGHWYFTLKDAGAQLRGVCFRGSQRRVSFQPRNGMEVLARGRISVYEPRGEYQLIVEEMLEYGLGNLQRAFEQLKEKLKQEGLFEAARKKPLPLLPGRVGVVTSPTGAAIRDILQVLRRRNSAVQVLIYPVRVQGEGSALEIAEGIRWFDANPVVDVLIVGRGGGSLEDLWAFNEEPVARAIFACRIPVISAVGHEIDFTIADFVADLRAPTPSAAAEVVAGAAEELSRRVEAGRKIMSVNLANRLAGHRNHLKVLVLNRALTAVPHRVRTMIQKVDDWQRQLQYLVNGLVQARSRRLADLRQRLFAASPARRLREQAHRLAMGREALRVAMAALLAVRRKRHELAGQRLAGLSPKAVLERGYAICLDGDGRVVRRWQAVSAGQPVDVLLGEGALGCTVETSRPEFEKVRSEE
jgi:exodeoxyribonuclease VII large subunit